MKIEIQSATKIIGNNKVLNDITMTLEGGNIYGFTGHNGSGKTMLIRAICGLMKLSEGSIVFSDKADIGLLIENIGLYPDLSAFDNLKCWAVLYTACTLKARLQISSSVQAKINLTCTRILIT